MKKVPPGEAAHFFSARAWRRKSVTGVRKGHVPTKAHERATVFGQDHAQTKMLDGRNRS
jgi:hypothetical protein